MDLQTTVPESVVLGQEALNRDQVVHVGVTGQCLPFRLQAADTQEEILVGSCGGELTIAFKAAAHPPCPASFLMPASWSSLTACRYNHCPHTTFVSDSGPASYGRAPDPPFALHSSPLPGRLRLHQRADGEWEPGSGRDHVSWYINTLGDIKAAGTCLTSLRAQVTSLLSHLRRLKSVAVLPEV